MDKKYMDMAYEEASKSTCLREKVGAVLVKDNKVIAKGYNNVIGGVKDCVDTGCIRDILNIEHGSRREICKAVCAEQLAISEAARNGVKLDGSKAYITVFPCHICAKLLVSSGINEIIYDKEYPDKLAQKFFEEAGVIVRQI